MTTIISDTKSFNIQFPLTDSESQILDNSEERLNISVANVLGRRIVVGNFPENFLLPKEKELWELFGVSRTVLREAVKALVEKGLIQTRQKAGTKVNSRSLWNLFDRNILLWLFERGVDKKLLDNLVELRSAIEPAAVKLAAIRANEQDLLIIESAYIKMENAQTASEYLSADVEFHMAIFSACKNEFLLQLRPIVTLILQGSFSIQQRSVIKSSEGLALHKNILDKIMMRDAEGGETVMKYIIIKAKDELKNNNMHTNNSR